MRAEFASNSQNKASLSLVVKILIGVLVVIFGIYGVDFPRKARASGAGFDFMEQIWFLVVKS